MEKRKPNFRFPYVSVSQRVCFTLVVVLYCASNLFAVNDDYSTWKYSGRLYLNTMNTGANVSGDVLNYPVLIRLSSSNFSFGESKLDGTDIRFAKSDGTHLPYEIERWDYASKVAELWVGVDTVYGNNNSQYILCYWGKGGAGDSSSANNVFATSEGFQGVWHLEEDGNTTASGYKDATSNANHGTGYSMTSSSDVSGIIGLAQDFDGTADYIQVATHSSIKPVNITLSAWVKSDNATWNNTGWVIAKRNGTNGNGYFLHPTSGGVTLQGYVGVSDAWYNSTITATDITGWDYYTMTYDGSTIRNYLNGAEQTTNATPSGNITYNGTDNPTYIGRDDPSQAGRFGDGKIDEPRISSSVRSADWIKLSYQNQQTNDSLVSGDLRHEDYHDWAYSKTFVLNTTDAGANVTGNVTDFPLLIRLHSINFTFSEALSAGADIRFAKSDGTHLKYEIERWDATNSLAEIWVKVDTVYGNNQTQFIKMYWGKAGATSYSNPEAVFETGDGFAGVWHLEEDGNTTSDGYVDATGNGDDGTGVSMTSSSDITAVTGLGQDFDGTSDYIDVGTSTNLDAATAMTVSMWVYANNLGFSVYDGLFARGSSGQRVPWLWGHSTFNYLKFEFETTTGGVSDGVTWTSDLTEDTWHFVTFTWDGSTVRTYLDGVAGMTDATTGTVLANTDGTNYLGHMTGFDTWDGKIDEIRTSTSARSADYIKLSYMNQRTGDLLVMENMSDWTYSRAVLLNTETSGGGITSTLTDFPTLIRLHAGNFTFSEAQGSGQDIRFHESDGDALSYEIERWDSTNALAEIWVRIPSISGNSTTEFITMHWGNANAKDLSYEEHVFETTNNFRGVWHLNEDGNTTTDGYDDASGNDADATGTSMTSSSDVTGLIGLGQDFDGTADYLYASGVNLPTADLTYSVWVKLDAVNDEDILMGSNTAGDNEIGIFVDPDFDWTIDNSSPSGADVDAVTGTWYHIALTRSSGSAVLYANGVSVATTTDNDSLTHNSCGLLFGTDSDSGCNGGLGNWMDGIMDEPRASGVARSADWIKLSYMNQKAIPQFADAEDYSKWTNSAIIDINTTVSGTNVSGNVADFPFLLRFTSDNFTFTEALDGGTDLRFAGSGGEHLAFEVERWDSTNALGEVWVKLHSVLGNNNTQYIKMYWGNTNAVARSDGETVFSTSDGFDGVWHMNEASGNINDATWNNYTGTKQGDPTYAQTAIVGQGIDLDGTGDYFSLSTNSIITGAAVRTASIWARTDVFSDGGLFDWGTQATLENFCLRTRTTDNDWREQLWGSDVDATLANSKDNWHYYTLAYDGTNVKLYYDGVLDNSTARALNTTTTGGLANIGRYGSADEFDGILDEMRLSDVERSADWIKLSYENQRSAQVSFSVKDDLNGWSYSRNMFLNTQSSGANVTNNVLAFPILIRLNDESFDFTQAQGSGQDIRFSKSNGDQLDYEIERWDSTNALAEIWVMVDTVYGNNSSQYITMYWGNSTAISRSDGAAVFSTTNGFAGVWHMGNDPSGGANAMKDATANQNHGTSGGSMTTGDLVTGTVGQAIDFDGSDDNINVGSDVSLDDLDNITVSGWINATGWGENNFGRIFDKNSNLIYYISNAVNLETFRLVRYRATTNTDVDIPDNTVNLSEWVYLTATMYSTDSTELFKNGIEPTLNSATFGSGALTTDAAADLYIGNNLAGDRAFSGLMDELRISSVNRSADWEKLSYENQKANNSLVGVEDYNSWNHKTNIYINTTASGANTSADVLAFPYLVRLDSFNFNFSQAQSSGEDLRFSKSDGVHISYEIERWDATNEVAEIWVKLDTVYDAIATQYFTMYWGKSTAADHQNSENVFSVADNFNFVYHLEEDGNTTTDGYIDATGNNIHATGVSMTTSSDVSATVGLGQSFDGSADYLNLGTAGSLNGTGSFSVCSWLKCTGTDGELIGMRTTATTDGEYEFKTDGTGKLHFYIYNAGYQYQITSTVAVNDGNWHHVCAVRSGNDGFQYIDGSKDANTGNGTALALVNTLPTNMARDNRDTDSYLNGTLDEFRVSTAARSDDWIKLSYHNQRSDDFTSNFADDLTEWSNSTKLYLNTQSTGANVSGNVLNFAALVRLTSSEFNFSEAMSDGADIRFSKSDGSALSYEIERWDNVNKLAEIWVKLDTVYGDNATQYMKMYWGRPNSISRSNPENVFNSTNNYVGVWHLGEEGSTTASAYKDATDNDHDGTGVSMTSESDVTGQIGKAAEFDGSADYIDIVDIASTVSSGLSVCAWANWDAYNSWGRIIDFGQAGQDDDNILLSGNGTGTTLTGEVYNGATGGKTDATSALSTGTWLHFCYTHTSAGATVIYKNGASHTTGSGKQVPQSVTRTTNYIGESNWAADAFFDGTIDEVRVHNSVLSADWVKLSYENQKTSQSLICFEENYVQDWTYKQDLTLNTSPGGANVTGDVNDFPVLVRLSSGNFDFSQAQGSGQDLRFTKSDGTPMFYEIERWDSTNAAAEIWVRVDTVYGTNSSQYLTMHWGNSTASSKSNANAVFDINLNFEGVWHLEEDGNTTTDGYIDATSNDYLGTGVSLTTSSDVSAVVGTGHDFDGSADYIDLNTSAEASITNNFCFSFWALTDDLTADDYVYGRDPTDGNLQHAVISGYDDNDMEFFAIGYTGTNPRTGSQIPIPDNTNWYYYNYTYDGTTWKGYRDGSQIFSTAVTFSLAATTSSVRAAIGAPAVGTSNFYNGKIDEFRISSTNRSADWIKLSYENQKTAQTLVNFSSPATSYSKATRFLFNTTSSSADVQGDVTDIPILIRIDSSHIDFSITKSDGSDILFTDSSGAMLYHEVVLWDKGNDTALVWVKVPTVDGNSDDDYIDIHYGCGNCSNDFHKADSVWNGYDAVYHLIGGETQATDITSNAYNLTYSQAMPFSSGVTAPYAPTFDGSSADAQYTSGVAMTATNNFSFSTWFNWGGSTSGVQIIFHNGATASSGCGFLLQNTDSHNMDILCGGVGEAETETAPTAGTWYHLVGVRDAGTMKIYINGSSQSVTGNPTPATPSGKILIGSNGSGEYYKGSMQETRIASSAHSADYIKLSYENQKLGSTFLSSATINGPVPVPGLIFWVKADSGVTKNSNDQVTKWDDISGAGNHAVQSNQNQAPVYKANVLGGKPILRFDGTDDNYDDILTNTDISNKTIFAVFSHDHNGSGNPAGALFSHKNAGSSSFYPMYSDGKHYLGYGGGNISATSSFTRNTFYIVTTYHGTSLTNLYKNNQVVGTNASNTIATDDFDIGYSQTNGLDFKGDLAELLFYERALTDVERGQVYNYLTDRYFLTPKILTTLTASTNISGNVDLNWTQPVSSSPMADTVGVWAKLNTYPDSSRNGILVGYFKTTDTSYTWSVDYPGVWHFTLLVRDTNDNWSNVSNQAQDTAAVFGNAGVKLTFNTSSTGAAVDEDQVNFPMLVRLVAADSGIFNACPNADGTHMRFIDDDAVTFLDYEVERYDNSSDLAEFWVRVPVVDGNSSTDFITMEYRGCNNPDATNSESVFPVADGHVGIWHLNEDGGTTTNGYKDASDNNHHGTGVSMTTSSDVTGIVGLGSDFDGTADYIDVVDISTSFANGASACAWVKWDALNSWSRIIDFGEASGGSDDNLVFANNTTTTTVTWEAWNGATGGQSNFTSATSTATWYHFCATNTNAGVTQLFKDGTLFGTQTGKQSPTTVTRASNYIGESNWAADAFFDGIIDELRLHNMVLTADWIKLSYETQKTGSSVITQSLIQRIYVDSALGSDNFTCIQAENPSTPKRTITSAVACAKHDAADTVRVLVQPGTYTDSSLTNGNHHVLVGAADVNNSPILNGYVSTPDATLEIGTKLHLRNLLIRANALGSTKFGIKTVSHDDYISIIGCRIYDGVGGHSYGITQWGNGGIEVLIANNIVQDVATYGILSYSNNDVNITHNVVFGPNTSAIYNTGTAADDISITNNILYNSTNCIYTKDTDDDIGLISNNLYFNCTNNVIGIVAGADDTDDSPVTGDPLFVSTNILDPNGFKVSSNSPALNAGTNNLDPNTSFSNTATIDLWGTVRPVGSARDIGVYEGTGISQSFTGEFDTLTTVKEGSDTVGVHTGKWAIIFRKTEGGGIADLRDKDAWATNLLGSDPLFDVNLSGTIASGVTTNAPKILSKNRVQAVVRQEQILTANFNMIVDYTIYPSGHIYVQSKIINVSGSTQSNKTLDYQFEISAEDAGFQNAGNQDGYGYLTTSTRDVYVGVTEALNLPNSLTWDANFTAGNNHIVWDTDDIDFNAGDEFEHHFLIYIGDESLTLDKSATIYNDSYYPQKLDAITGTPFASEAWEQNLVGQWLFDEGAGSTARDVSGNTRNGTITSATYTTGKSQTSLDFTTSAYVTVSHHADFDAGNDRTYMAWVKKTSTFSGSESDARFLSKGSDLILGRSTSANQVIFTAGGTTLTDPDATPNDAWFHIAATIDAGKISRLYVNGVLKDVSSAQIAAAGNSSDLLVGKNGSNTGFDGEIDDVRIYHQALTSDAIQAIYNEGFSHMKGAYRGRASNNNRFVGIMNQTSDVGRFQPVLMIDNWYGGDVPQYLYIDGIQMSHYSDFVSIEEPHGGGGNTLILQLNKTITGTDIDIFIDDNDSSGFLGASSIMPTLHTAVTASDQITVKNLSGATFGNVGSEEWEFIIDLDGSTGTTDGDGGIYSWKSSEISPNLAISSATDLTGSDSVTLDQMKFDNVALSGASWTSPDPNTYTIDDSSSTRLKITMGATTINVGTPDVVDARTYTFYPTGKIFVSHSITSISSQPTTPQIWIERLNSITASTDATSSTTPQDSARGGKLSDSNISGSFHGFGVSVLSVKSNGTTVSGQTAVTGNSNASDAFALNFNNTYFETADATITVNYMIDFTQNYTTAASLDSALQDVQQITSLTAVTGTVVTNDAMDFNTDGFAEGEGVWTYSASSGVAEFKLNATQARFHPAFKISSWNSSSLPQIVMVNNAEQVKGYHYNATVDGTNNALIIQFNKVFTGATNNILISQNASLAVTLSSFSAIGGEGVDTLKWITESELDNLGFYVLRRIKPKVPTGKKTNSEKLPYNSQKNDQLLDNNPDSLKTPILSAAELVKLDTTWKRLNKNLVPGPKGGRSSSTRKYLFIDRAVKYEVTYEYILVSVDVNSLEDFFGPVEAMPTYPSQTKLYGNYPNPFNPMTNIRFDLRAYTKLSLKIYDVRGHLIRTLIDPSKPLPPGQYRYTWDAKDDFGIEVPSGHYIYMFVTPRYKKARKMTLLK